MSVDDTSYTGHREVVSSGSPHNAESLNVTRAMDERRTNTVFKILKVYPGKDGAAPTADCAVMIDQVDGLDQRKSHGTVYGVAVGRTHSGAGTVVADPQVGDLYHAAISDRDLSQFKATGDRSGPGSRRKGSLSDAMLTHAILAGKPKQALDFKDGNSLKLYDGGGASVETSGNGSKVTVKTAKGGTVVLKDGMTYLGGDPDAGGTFDFVMTASGPSSTAKAKL